MIQADYLFRFIGPSHMSNIREVRLIGCDDRDFSFQAAEKLLVIEHLLFHRLYLKVVDLISVL
jgi:hypothetical protein